MFNDHPGYPGEARTGRVGGAFDRLDRPPVHELVRYRNGRVTPAESAVALGQAHALKVSRRGRRRPARYRALTFSVY